MSTCCDRPSSDLPLPRHRRCCFATFHQIKDPLLLIDNKQANNASTVPIQSEPLFQAIKGPGGTARLVMLHNESHGFLASESIFYMLHEMN